MCSADDFDALVIPGGFAPDFLRRHEAVIKLVRHIAEQGKPIAAICHGPWVLCSTPARSGKKATCFFAIKDDVDQRRRQLRGCRGGARRQPHHQPQAGRSAAFVVELMKALAERK